MTLKTPFITGLAVAAVVVGAQAAWASPQDASDRAIPSATVPSDAFERAALQNQLPQGLAHVYRDAHESVSADARGFVSTPPSDAFERSVIVTQQGKGAVLAGDSHGRVELQTPSTPVATSTSAREIEWPQIGAGFGIGILLGLGMLLAVRATRIRPLAH